MERAAVDRLRNVTFGGPVNGPRYQIANPLKLLLSAAAKPLRVRSTQIAAAGSDTVRATDGSLAAAG